MASRDLPRPFAVRAWIAIASAAFLATSIVGAASAPGSFPASSGARVSGPSAGQRAQQTEIASASTDGYRLVSLRSVRAAAAQVDAAAAVSSPVAPVVAPAARVTAPAPRPIVYAGQNHFWYPALGINQSVAWFPCDRGAPPDNLVYRWGCAGTNNVYLMAHAGGKFRPLYNAYYAGRLRAGQLAIYADASGVVHYYRLAWYKVTPPLASSHWAWDPQSASSLTLQTCLGTHSELRLFVRYVEVARP